MNQIPLYYDVFSTALKRLRHLNGTVIGAFGNNTSKAVEDAGMKLEIKVPSPQKPSMVAALDQFLFSTVSVKK